MTFITCKRSDTKGKGNSKTDIVRLNQFVTDTLKNLYKASGLDEIPTVEVKSVVDNPQKTAPIFVGIFFRDAPGVIAAAMSLLRPAFSIDTLFEHLA